MCIRDRPISTDRLYELGLINRIIERKAFDTEIDILCKQLLNYDTKEIRTLKSKFVHLINTN